MYKIVYGKTAEEKGLKVYDYYASAYLFNEERCIGTVYIYDKNNYKKQAEAYFRREYCLRYKHILKEV